MIDSSHFLMGGGAMGAMMRAHDWSASPLGQPETWPQSLRTTVGLMLGSKFPMFVAWGDELGFLYNDAYVDVLGVKHPTALGRPFHDIWGEIWHDISPLIDAAMAGEATYRENLPLVMERKGFKEETWFTFSYSPVRDESGVIAGMFCACTETTGQVLAERRLTEERDRQRKLFEQAPGFITILSGPELRFEFVNEAFDRLFGRRDFVGRTVREAFPDLEDQPFFGLLDKAYATGERLVARASPIRLQATPEADPTDRYLDFIYEPVRDEAGAVTGLFIEGYDVTEAFAAQEAQRESESRFRALVTASSDVVYRMSPDWAEMRRLDGRGFLRDTKEPSVRWLDDYLFPEDRPDVVAAIDEAIRGAKNTFELEHRVRRVDGGIGWVFSRAVPVLGAEGEIIEWFGAASDITERKRAESGRSALIELSDVIREVKQPDDLAYAAAEILGRTLAVSRAGYGTIDKRNETITIERDWNAPGVKSLAGTLHFRDYGSYIEDLKRGDTVVFADAETDPRTAANADALKAISAQSVVNMPVTEQGDFVALLYLNHATARAWSNAELELIGEFAARTRTAVERVRAEAELGESEQRYRALFEAVDDGFCIIEFFDGPHGPSSDYVHVEANPGYERQTGIPGIVGRTLRDLAPGEAEGWLDLYGGVLRTGDPIRFERAFLTAGRHIEVSAARIEPASRRQVSVLFRDVSARRQAEDALRASEALARENGARVQIALAAGAIIGTWHWDMTTDRFRVDDAFARAFGLDPALGREGIPLAQIVATVHPDDQAGLAAAIDEAVARGGAYAHQYRTRRADGRYYWLEANGRVDRAPDGTPVSFPGVLIDIEERRAVEAERARVTEQLRSLNETLEQRVAERTSDLMQAEEALRQSQKMEAVGQLTGGLAHDFNNLLAGISGSLELMQSRMQQGRFTDVERYMVAAQGAAKRAAALTHRLLAFSRRQTLDPRPTNVNNLVSGMQEMIQRTVGPAIPVEVVGASGLWPAMVDASQLENALLNLCINARDAMPDGGRITVETANRWLDERAALQHDVPEGQYLSMCVTDTGTGMTPDVIARAFEPFFTTKPIGEGTGLGLSMIYGFAQQSGGQVRIYSELGKGTTVCLYLPRHYGEVAVEGIVPKLDAVPHSERGATVLVVDDEPTVRMLVTDILDDLGYTAIEAGDSAAGLRILQSDVRIDLLVTDVGLPGGMNGRQMADAGRATRPDLKVLFITGYAENAVLGNGHLAPGMAVLTKPFPMDTMAARIRSLIEADKEARHQRSASLNGPHESA